MPSKNGWDPYPGKAVKFAHERAKGWWEVQCNRGPYRSTYRHPVGCEPIGHEVTASWRPMRGNDYDPKGWEAK